MPHVFQINERKLIKSLVKSNRLPKRDFQARSNFLHRSTCVRGLSPLTSTILPYKWLLHSSNFTSYTSYRICTETRSLLGQREGDWDIEMSLALFKAGVYVFLYKTNIKKNIQFTSYLHYWGFSRGLGTSWTACPSTGKKQTTRRNCSSSQEEHNTNKYDHLRKISTFLSRQLLTIKILTFKKP